MLFSHALERLLPILVDQGETDVASVIKLYLAKDFGPGYENARRRLENVRLKTTYPAAVSQALTAGILKHKDTLAEHLPVVVEAVLKLAIAEHELEENERRIEERRVDADFRASHELYAEARRVVNALYKHHKVGEAEYRLLDGKDVSRLAGYVQQLCAAKREAASPLACR